MAESGNRKTKFFDHERVRIVPKRVGEMFGENGVEVEVL